MAPTEYDDPILDAINRILNDYARNEDWLISISVLGAVQLMVIFALIGVAFVMHIRIKKLQEEVEKGRLGFGNLNNYPNQLPRISEVNSYNKPIGAGQVEDVRKPGPVFPPSDNFYSPQPQQNHHQSLPSNINPMARKPEPIFRNNDSNYPASPSNNNQFPGLSRQFSNADVHLRPNPNRFGYNRPNNNNIDMSSY